MVENLIFWVVENIIFWVVDSLIFGVVDNVIFFWVVENMIWGGRPFLEGGIHAFGWSFLLIVWWLEPVVTPVGLKVL